MHLILQNILSLGSILIFGSILTKVKESPGVTKPIALRVLILAVILSLLTLINPLYTASNALAMVLAGIIIFITRPSIRRLLLLVVIGFILAVSLIPSAHALIQTFNIPYYQYFRWWENQIRPTNWYIFSHSVGPILLFATAGLIPFLWKLPPLRTLGVIWAIVPIALYFSPIPNRLGIPYFRLPQPPSYVILAALAVEGMYLPGFLLSRLNVLIRSKRTSIPSESNSSESVNSILLGIFYIFLIPYLAFQLPMIREEIRARTNNYTLTSWMNHLDPGVIEGLTVLGRQPKTKIALSINNLELLTPVISGQTMYVAHHSLTYEYPKKIADAVLFFTRQMDADTAKNFLATHNIGYILWKKADGDVNLLKVQYPFLKSLYENTSIVVFTL